jgi:uncharacterized membrane protein
MRCKDTIFMLLLTSAVYLLGILGLIVLGVVARRAKLENAATLVGVISPVILGLCIWMLYKMPNAMLLMAPFFMSMAYAGQAIGSFIRSRRLKELRKEAHVYAFASLICLAVVAVAFLLLSTA